MRLSKIKLAGFKSFVDPTSIVFPSNLIGVVGPNGCGKSNIIDAVRWVMGESSAKHLRGESMQDVIFSGSNTRKPVGTATVELIFDNSDGTVTGEYASFNEISVKRQVSRDGQSGYFLNNARCRRRDISDVFLGTGLGPRSYSIIEQGMISRIVESKPEELRVYLEEAAGISKYKERRRETENRIRHTKENLERLYDLREEIGKQLKKLQRQAKAAVRYKELKEEQRNVRAELSALQWQELQNKASEFSQSYITLNNSLEKHVAEQRSCEAIIETSRDEHISANDHFNEVQSEMYRVRSEITRLEQFIQHTQEMKAHQQVELTKAEKSGQELEAHIAVDKEQLDSLRLAMDELIPQTDDLKAQEEQAAEVLAEVESSMENWQEQWENHNKSLASIGSATEVEKTRINHLDRHLHQLATRRQAIQDDSQKLDVSALEKTIQSLQSQEHELDQKNKSLSTQLSQQKSQLSDQEELNRELNQILHQRQQDSHASKGRLSSLEALQQAALGKNDKAGNAWLSLQSLDDSKRLAQQLTVEPDWERAVETVLGNNLEAVLCDQASRYIDQLSLLEEGGVILADADGSFEAADSDQLLSKLSGPAVVVELMESIYCAEDLDSARVQLSRLSRGQSVVTQRGEWIGHGWMKVSRDDSAGQGVLAREQEIKSIELSIKSLEQQIDRGSEALSKGRQDVQQLRLGVDELQHNINDNHKFHSQLLADIKGSRNRMTDAQLRLETLKTEAIAIQEQIEEHESDSKSARDKLERHIESMASMEATRGNLSSEMQDITGARNEARQRLKSIRESSHQVALKRESSRVALNSTEQALSRIHSQLEQLEIRKGDLQKQVSDVHNPLIEKQSELKVQLEKNLLCEKTVHAARESLDKVDLKIREMEKGRQEHDQLAQSFREKVEQVRLQIRESEIHCDNLDEQIRELELDRDRDEVLRSMDESAAIDAWQRRIEELAKQTQRLEPVNLAAIDECEEQAERQSYLDAQNEDLEKALATLEAAIHKIDKETRTRFKETFEKVNSGMQKLFPRLFGGGHGFLEMTSDDLLTTGIAIMARPPGKRISNIHLLSGGEKALTAVALVFAIFHLNPSPFCMLDEVDAPLDDANVGRFTQMVVEMSEKVQFLCVTHNKITMEVAQQLMGVTMHEPGVSRLVSVDVEEATKIVNG